MGETNGRTTTRELGHRTTRPSCEHVGSQLALAALALWILVALTGIGTGLAVAKYSQQWANDMLHPGVGVGIAAIAHSIAIALVASKAAARSVASAPRQLHSLRLLVGLSFGLIAGAGWVALMLIVFARPAGSERL